MEGNTPDTGLATLYHIFPLYSQQNNSFEEQQSVYQASTIHLYLIYPHNASSDSFSPAHSALNSSSIVGTQYLLYE